MPGQRWKCNRRHCGQQRRSGAVITAPNAQHTSLGEKIQGSAKTSSSRASRV